MISIHPTAVIYSGVKLGEDCWVGPYVVIGDPPGHADYDPRGEFCGVVIGAGTVIHAHSTIQSGIDSPTCIGADVVIMAESNVGHDCIVRDRVQLMRGACLAGCVTVKEYAILGMHACVHQGLVIGARSIVGMSSAVVRDVPDNAKAYGVPARIRGVNRVGLKKLGWSEEEITRAYFRLCQRSQLVL